MTSSNRSAATAAFISVPETAGFLGVSDDLVYDLIERGELPSTSLGRRKLVPRRAVELVLERAMENFDPDRLLAALARAGDPSSVDASPAASAGGSPGQAGTGVAVLTAGGR